jgi:sulfopyruvate decarboxylase TPP-binding subunit
MSWSDTFLDAFKKNDVRFISYVPDNVLTPLIKGVTSDNYFIPVNATRENEAMGMVAGAWMGGVKGAVMMQTSGFAVAPNAPSSRPRRRARRVGVMRAPGVVRRDKE